METSDQEARVQCPYCKELILQGALKCKHCGTNLRRQIVPSGNWVWARNLPDRKLLGVSACIASNFRVSATIVRLVFVLLTFVSLLGLFIYLLLAAIIPAEQGKRSLFEAAVDAMGAALDNLRNRPAPAPDTSGAPVSAQPVSPAATPAAEPPPVPTTPPDTNAPGQPGL